VLARAEEMGEDMGADLSGALVVVLVGWVDDVEGMVTYADEGDFADVR